MRSKRKGGSTLRAFLVSLGVPALALFVLFSLVSYERMTAEWPLGISAEEVHLYQRWFDQRPDTMAEVEVRRFDLDSTGACLESEEARVWRHFSTNGYADSARVSHAGDGWMIVFPDERPFQGQYALLLSPATLPSVRALYARELADSWDLPHGRAELVRLWSCGDDAGLFLAEEVITQRFVDAHGTPGSMLMDSLAQAGADSSTVKEAGRAVSELIEEGDTSRIHGKSAEAWAAIAAAAQLEMGESAGIWFQPASREFITALISTGRPGSDAAEGGSAPVSSYLSTLPAREAIRAMAERDRKDSARISGLLAEVDARNASAFVGDTRIGYVRAQLGQERKEFLHRLLHPEEGPGAGSPPVVPVKKPVAPMELDPLLRKYLVGDTVRFPRAKHLIDHVITVPAGYGVVLEKGARLNMAPGAGLIVNGALHMRGTGLNPVFIRPTDDHLPWAGIRVNGTGGTRCGISGLRMSGGSALPADDAAGMLSFQDCDVAITKSTMTDAGGPAMVSVTRGTLAMEECYLGTARNALIDLAFAEARFNGSSFMGGAPSGVRMKASVARVSECGFVRFSAVALSAELKSRLLAERCTFSENGSAVLLKDGAQGYWDGCAFKGNTLAFDVRCDKPALGGGQVTSFQNTFEGNGTDKRMDAKSSWREGDRPGEETFSSPRRAD